MNTKRKYLKRALTLSLVFAFVLGVFPLAMLAVRPDGGVRLVVDAVQSGNNAIVTVTLDAPVADVPGGGVSDVWVDFVFDSTLLTYVSSATTLPTVMPGAPGLTPDFAHPTGGALVDGGTWTLTFLIAESARVAGTPITGFNILVRDITDLDWDNPPYYIDLAGASFDFVEAPVPATGITAVSPTTATIQATVNTVDLEVELETPAGWNTSGYSVNWTTSAAGTATVAPASTPITGVDNATATVTGVAEGTATITAQLVNEAGANVGTAVTFTITVTAAPAGAVEFALTSGGPAITTLGLGTHTEGASFTQVVYIRNVGDADLDGVTATIAAPWLEVTAGGAADDLETSEWRQLTLTATNVPYGATTATLVIANASGTLASLPLTITVEERDDNLGVTIVPTPAWGRYSVRVDVTNDSDEDVSGAYLLVFASAEGADVPTLLIFDDLTVNAGQTIQVDTRLHVLPGTTVTAVIPVSMPATDADLTTTQFANRRGFSTQVVGN